jgi:formylglycine-generating enzyme required for sulfatase activity/Leucine-rich repeat (LRR) protein
MRTKNVSIGLFLLGMAFLPFTSFPVSAQKAGKNPPKDFTNSIGMKFVWIKPGSFTMGSPKEEKERFDSETQHKVTLTKGFYIGVYTVTQEQWQVVMGNNPSKFKGEKHLPVENVSWNDCQEFIKKLREKDKKHYSLPTEAEWEYACRAGTTTPFSFGETISPDQANFNNPLMGKTTPVGSFPANAWGLYDMHGNVRQWCQDWLGQYSQEDVIDPQGVEKGELRVLRGGSWQSRAVYSRSAARAGSEPGSRLYFAGFRLCFFVEEDATPIASEKAQGQSTPLTEITADFLPHKPGSIRKYENEDTVVGKTFIVQATEEDLPANQIRTSFTRVGIKNGDSIAWDDTAPKEPSVLATYRQNQGFIEIGFVIDKRTVWHPPLKLGAKAGTTWEWDDHQSKQKHIYTVKSVAVVAERPEVVVEELITSRSGGTRRHVCTYAYGLGLILKQEFWTDKGVEKRGNTMRLIESPTAEKKKRGPMVEGQTPAKANDQIDAELNLSKKQVTDAELMRELAGHKNITTLDLSHARVTDAGLRELASLKTLSTLKLTHAKVTGIGLKSLTGLQNLDLTYTNVTDAGIKEMADLKNLTTLSLNGTKVTGMGLKELTGLQNLNLAYTTVTDAGMKELAELKKLTALSLNGTNVTDAGIKEMADLKNLTTLSLNGTKVTDAGMKELAELKKLTTLSLSDTNVTDAGMKEMADLKNLTTLSLYGTKVTGMGLKELTGLQNLNLGFTNVTDARMKELAGLKNLTTLSLYRTKVAAAGLKTLADVSNLNTLYLGGPNLTDAELKEVGGLTTLTTLHLSPIRLGTKVTNAGLKELSGINGLNIRLTPIADVRELGNVTDADLKELAGLKNLTMLDLKYTNVTDAGLKELAGLTNLTTLDLSGTKVTDAGLKELASLTNLTTLDLSTLIGVSARGVNPLRAALPKTKIIGYFR